MLRHFVLGEPVDVCFFFNISIWVKRWKEVFLLCSELAETVLFEAHGTQEQQKEQLNFVQSVYQDVSMISEVSDDDPTYLKRKMYVCEKKITRYLENDSSEDQFLKQYTEDDIKKVYREVFPKQSAQHVKIFPNTHESIVALVDDSFIVKFPRPNRGINGLQSEQEVTDLIRAKLNVAIPEISLHDKPVFMARYQKLSGKTFDKAQYKKLTNSEKQRLAAQIAECMLAFHQISLDEVQEKVSDLAPSWKLSIELIKEQLAADDGHVFTLSLIHI